MTKSEKHALLGLINRYGMMREDYGISKCKDKEVAKYAIDAWREILSVVADIEEEAEEDE